MNGANDSICEIVHVGFIDYADKREVIGLVFGILLYHLVREGKELLAGGCLEVFAVIECEAKRIYDHGKLADERAFIAREIVADFNLDVMRGRLYGWSCFIHRGISFCTLIIVGMTKSIMTLATSTLMSLMISPALVSD